ncbi:MAG TPA: hypothetical protein VGU72_09725 [Beijerinckiaceae bacterium]|jgi:hypothetical protein|nr:hypothetical protein [Beijerinckiaceae bacterium]
MIPKNLPPGTKIQCLYSTPWVDRQNNETPGPIGGEVCTLAAYNHGQNGEYIILAEFSKRIAPGKWDISFNRRSFRLLQKPRKRKALPEAITNFLNKKAPITGAEFEKVHRAPKKRRRQKVGGAHV